jgi:hypothetical protein
MNADSGYDRPAAITHWPDAQGFRLNEGYNPGQEDSGFSYRGHNHRKDGYTVKKLFSSLFIAGLLLTGVVGCGGSPTSEAKKDAKDKTAAEKKADLKKVMEEAKKKMDDAKTDDEKKTTKDAYEKAKKAYDDAPEK